MLPFIISPFPFGWSEIGRIENGGEKIREKIERCVFGWERKLGKKLMGVDNFLPKPLKHYLPKLGENRVENKFYIFGQNYPPSLGMAMGGFLIPTLIPLPLRGGFFFSCLILAGACGYPSRYTQFLYMYIYNLLKLILNALN